MQSSADVLSKHLKWSSKADNTMQNMDKMLDGMYGAIEGFGITQEGLKSFADDLALYMAGEVVPEQPPEQGVGEGGDMGEAGGDLGGGETGGGGSGGGPGMIDRGGSEEAGMEDLTEEEIDQELGA